MKDIKVRSFTHANITARSFWYDQPDIARKSSRWVLGIQIERGALGLRVCLTEDEMREALKALTTPSHDSAKPDTEMWWDYGCVEADGRYSLGETTTDEVPLMVYRDDHFYCHLPHQIGLHIMGMIGARLDEIEAVDYRLRSAR